ncbi:Rv3235 family protein [Streptomyces sp. NPDC052682]|uniref:Rv3235 family protein n=1 Tax=Streptomyces sp. NPDC052682 TaxID=3154954 RepID=UPI0034458566
MHKVMSRAQHHQPGSRPPGRRDSRRPGGTPPRTPGGTRPLTAPGAGRPPVSPRTSPRTGPADGRPAAAPGRPAPATGAAVPVTDAPVPARYLPRPAAPQPRPTDVFADRLLLVLSGQRPVHWMLRHTAGRAYDELAWLAERGPLRTRGARPAVRDIGYFEPRPGVFEVFARIGAGDQLRAMAFRLERGRDLRWRCTAVELGGPRMRHTAEH